VLFGVKPVGAHNYKWLVKALGK